jgi:hypothetical protein
LRRKGVGLKERILHEVKSILWTSLYFVVWFGVLMLIKVLLLAEYQIKVYDVSAAIIGALVVAKGLAGTGKSTLGIVDPVASGIP